ncbi:MAG: hypothetical protein WDO19_07695 [Bacteroidota bacterium]
MRVYLLFVVLLFTVAGNAQPCLIAATGFSTDVNTNKNNSKPFNHIPVSLQWSAGGFKKILLVKLDYFIPFTVSATDHAYTLNPGLPAEIAVQKSIRPFIFCVNMGVRLPVYKLNAKNIFYADALLTAVCHQDIKVNYGAYDKTNYEILNPDMSLRKTSLSICTGLVYRYLLTNKSSLLCMLHLQGPPFATPKVKGYGLSYWFVAPLQLTIGYSFCYRKIKSPL